MLKLFLVITCSSFLISLFINGLRTISAPGKILNPIKVAIERLPSWASSPLISCIYCMPSIWGTLIYWGLILTTEGFSWPYLVGYPIAVLGASYLNIYFGKALSVVEKEPAKEFAPVGVSTSELIQEQHLLSIKVESDRRRIAEISNLILKKNGAR